MYEIRLVEPLDKSVFLDSSLSLLDWMRSLIRLTSGLPLPDALNSARDEVVLHDELGGVCSSPGDFDALL